MSEIFLQCCCCSFLVWPTPSDYWKKFPKGNYLAKHLFLHLRFQQIYIWNTSLALWNIWLDFSSPEGKLSSDGLLMRSMCTTSETGPKGKWSLSLKSAYVTLKFSSFRYHYFKHFSVALKKNFFFSVAVYPVIIYYFSRSDNLSLSFHILTRRGTQFYFWLIPLCWILLNMIIFIFH